MSTPTYKGIEIAHELASKVNARLNGALTVAESFDTDGCPLITIGSGTAGQKNIVFKVSGFAWPLATDSLGLTAGAYGPEVIQMVTEGPSSGTGQTIIDLQTLMNVMGDALRDDCQFQWYQSANGVAPTSAAISAGNLKATYWPSLYQTMRAAQ